MAHHGPPTPLENMDLRAWFAGCALSNPNVIKDCAKPEDATAMAFAVADTMLAALRAPGVPSISSLNPPSEEEMNAWARFIEKENNLTPDEQEARDKQTVVEQLRKPRQTIAPPPPSSAVSIEHAEIREAFVSAKEMLKKVSSAKMPAVRSAGAYRVVDGVERE